MKNLLLTFDVEEFSLPRVLYNLDFKEKELEISHEGLNNLLKILDKHNVKATFFTTAVFAKKYPSLIKKISKKHEIALHALDHTDDYSKFSDEDIHKRLKKAKQIIEKITNKKLYGFRAPLFRNINPEILKKLNLNYDSSINPIFLPGYYINIFQKRKIHKKNNLTMVPVAATPIVRMPLSWIFFRNFPLLYSKICTRLCLIDQNHLVLVFHPWEFVDLSSYKIMKLYKRNTGKILINKLDKYLSWCDKNNIKYLTIKDYLFRK